MANPVGRPPKFKTVEEIEEKIESYFEYIEEAQEPPTITGMALHLGFVDRQSFYDYGDKPQFTGAIKKARLIIEKAYEKRLHGSQPTGAIFALKNLGWKDTHEVENKIEVKKTVSLRDLEAQIMLPDDEAEDLEVAAVDGTSPLKLVSNETDQGS